MKIISLFCIIVISSCSTFVQMKSDIDEGFYDAEHRLPQYEVVLIPSNAVAIEREMQKGNVWVIPDKYRNDYKEVE